MTHTHCGTLNERNDMDKASVVAALRRAEIAMGDKIKIYTIEPGDAAILRTLADRIESGTVRTKAMGVEIAPLLVIDWTPIGDRKP